MPLNDFPSQIFDALSDAMAVLDDSGQKIYANPAFLVLETYLADGIPPKTGGGYPELIPETARGGAACPATAVTLSLGSRSVEGVVYSLNKSLGVQAAHLVLVRSDQLPAGSGKMPQAAGAADLNPEQGVCAEPLSPVFQSLRGEEPVFRKALVMAQKAAATDLPVLILGESGTGKEILARTIHKAGRRGQNTFVDVNCAAIPENLIESELFGYEKGAFTGAGPKGRRGLFEEAHEGSIFLDEIGDASLLIQTKILRVLQEKCFKRVGGNRNISVNVRHISATNRDLATLIGEGRFREDLFYRLNTLTIVLPPLRERPGDIPLLIEHFARQYAGRKGRRIWFSMECLEIMQSYGWPGNVRELKGVVDYAVTMAEDSRITPDCLPSFLLPRRPGARTAVAPPAPPAMSVPVDQTLPAAVQMVEKALIKRAMETSPNKSAAIRTLGISRRTFYAKIKQYGFE